MNTPATTKEKLNNFLLTLKRQGDDFSLSQFIAKINPPYKNTIQSVIVNLNLVKWVSNGRYTAVEFVINDGLINTILTTCREAANKPRKSIYKTPDMTKPPVFAPVEKVREVIKPVQPFGLDTFDTIMVEKGSITIGEYILEGSFTITRIKE